MKTRVDVNVTGSSEPEVKASEPQDMEILRKVEKNQGGCAHTQALQNLLDYYLIKFRDRV